MVSDYVNTGKVRFVYRHLVILGAESMRAAEASECASDQGKFWEYHDVLFLNWAGENAGGFSDANLKAFAGRVGLDARTFGACLDGGQRANLVRQDTDKGNSLGVRSTPTVFVNNAMLAGLADYSVYKRLIEQALQQKP